MHFATNNEICSPTMDAIVNWVNQGRDSVGAWHNGTDIMVVTPKGEIKASVGDWIVRYPSGEFYPCKPGAFDAEFEPES